jgi:large subunit ribosomal protein L9
MPNTKSSPKRKSKAGARCKRLPVGPHGGVELLLIQPVEHLGKQGEVVEVRPGYANNFLLPQGLATIASDHHKRMIEKHRARLAEIQRERLAGFRKMADLISQQSITIEANANDEGHLYGSVGPAEIVAGLKRNGITITADQVRMEGAIKELGLYTIKVHLVQDVAAELKAWVVPSVADDQPSQPATS